MTGPTVALTFDDGPSRWTPALLDALAAHLGHATFFVLGCHIAGREQILQRALLEGHELGVHGWDHTAVPELSAAELGWQLQATVDALTGLGAPRPGLWRAPWQQADAGALDVARGLGLAHCSVTLDGRDVSRPANAVVRLLAPRLHDDAVVGLHDGVAPNGEQHVRDRLGTVAAVEQLLKLCRSVTVSELLAAAA